MHAKSHIELIRRQNNYREHGWLRNSQYYDLLQLYYRNTQLRDEFYITFYTISIVANQCLDYTCNIYYAFE